jgi:hypothetical protein
LRTITDRRRCRSIPTYCDAIGAFLLTMIGLLTTTSV